MIAMMRRCSGRITIIQIPPNKIKWDRGNPTGHTVVFLSSARYVYCFVQNGGI